MRVTQDRLYDSEATLRLVDRVLDELDAGEPLRPAAPHPSGYRTEQLRAEADPGSTGFLRAYWELHDALELLRDGHAALRPSLGAAAAGGDPHGHLDRALALVDQLQGDGRDPAHEALRGELLALAAHLRAREADTDRLHLTADLLLDLESRLAQVLAASS